MKLFIRSIGVAALIFGCTALIQAQTSPAASPATAAAKSGVAGGTNAGRTDIYHVHVVHAAPGKAAELGESMKQPGPSPAPQHQVVFRHQYGDSWDYVVVGHYGTKYTLEAVRPQIPPDQRSLSDSHTDTFVNGPSWAEFSRAMGLDDPKKSTGAVYVVSLYRSVPGGREALEKNLAEPPDPAMDKAAGTALMQHLEGADWNFLGIVRYNSWADLATSQTNSVPKTAEKDSGWSKMRESTATHTDTLCDRLLP
ncbi:MAG TPA: hypothetical protein VJ719_11930 [Chthoniobacterales bacterium]|nr:hypothetical protein [Chthoniobacterales bacterium]